MKANFVHHRTETGCVETPTVAFLDKQQAAAELQSRVESYNKDIDVLKAAGRLIFSNIDYHLKESGTEKYSNIAETFELA